MAELLLVDLSLLDELEACLLPEGDTILLLFLTLGAGELALRAGTSPSSSAAQNCQVLNLPRGPLGCLRGITASLSEVKLIITSVKLCIEPQSFTAILATKLA